MHEKSSQQYHKSNQECILISIEKYVIFLFVSCHYNLCFKILMKAIDICQKHMMCQPTRNSLSSVGKC